MKVASLREQIVQLNLIKSLTLPSIINTIANDTNITVIKKDNENKRKRKNDVYILHNDYCNSVGTNFKCGDFVIMNTCRAYTCTPVTCNFYLRVYIIPEHSASTKG